LHSFVVAFVAVLMVAGCAEPTSSYEVGDIRQGVIEQITPINLTNNQNQGLGAVLGGAAGLGLGSLIGSGTGRDVAMIAGAIGGAIVGNEVSATTRSRFPASRSSCERRTACSWRSRSRSARTFRWASGLHRGLWRGRAVLPR
jgi:hypothetical protein